MLFFSSAMPFSKTTLNALHFGNYFPTIQNQREWEIKTKIFKYLFDLNSSTDTNKWNEKKSQISYNLQLSSKQIVIIKDPQL